RCEIIREVFEMMLAKGLNEQSIANRTRNSSVIENEFSAAAYHEIQFVLVVGRLIVHTTRRKEDKGHSTFCEWLDIPNAVFPYIGRWKRELSEKFFNREFHF